MSSTNGPKQIGDTLGDSLDRLKIGIAKRHREKVEAAARPGESFAQAESRLRAEDAAKEREAAQEKERAQSAAIAAGKRRRTSTPVGSALSDATDVTRSPTQKRLR